MKDKLSRVKFWVFSPGNSENLMRYVTHRGPQSGQISQKLGHFFRIFENGQGRPPPPPSPFSPSSYAAEWPAIDWLFRELVLIKLFENLYVLTKEKTPLFEKWIFDLLMKQRKYSIEMMIDVTVGAMFRILSCTFWRLRINWHVYNIFNNSGYK